MRRKSALAVILFGVAVATLAPAQPAGTAPRPVVPAQPAAPAPAPAATAGAPQPAAERSDPRQGIVRLERAGQPLGLGLVLSGDGRIVTALSAVGHGNDVTA